eukprot:scaffold25787_cov64-Cyclotella_meneghiniana.AAC.3
MASVLFTHAARRTAVHALRSSRSTSLFHSSRCMSTYYTPAHEYCKIEGNVATVGITDFAQAALGDIVFVDLPETGDEFEAKDSFGSVESVKAASDVYAPISGKVVETNDLLTDDPGMVNTSAEGDAWFIKMEVKDDSAGRGEEMLDD